VGAQGVYPIERPTRTLSAMLAQAGGVSIDPEIAQVKVQRSGQTGTIWFQDLFENPRMDIALRGGDKILVEEDTRAFTALGATGTQARVPFETQNISAVEALAQVGGLVPTSSDPTGVFVFRNEPAVIANQVLGRTDLIGPQRLVYVLDLTKPNGMFMARDFVIRDQDTVYVTEAPFTQWSKVISAVTGTLGTVSTLATAQTALSGGT
jgi:polysaccharide export outer membrane protein